jgi:adenosylmethionine-8-amino-7-oxononanoate aminotransferase
MIEQIGAENIAAMVVEPVIGTGGVIPPAEGYLEGLRSLARSCEIVFVADEVVTGFGRLGRWFGSERWALEPDMITMAKGMTSGYLPLGAVGIAGWLSEPFAEPAAPILRHV